MSGADADALDQVGVRLERAAGGLRSKADHLRSELHAAPWHGRSADRFRQEFDATYYRSIRSAAQFIDDAKEVLRRNAEEQRVASAIGGRIAPSDQLDTIASIFSGLALIKGIRDLDFLKDFKGDWSGITGVELSALSLAMSVIALGLPEGSNWRLGAEATDHLADIASASLTFIKAVNGTAGKVVPLLGVIGGSVGMINDWNRLQNGQGNSATNLLSLSGNTMTVVGSAIMFVPGGQVIGAGVLAAGAITSGVSWAAEHHEQIEHFADDAVHVGSDVARESFKAITNPIGFSHDLMKGLL